MTDQIKKKALVQFSERKKYSSMLRKIDSHGAHADDPDYFYCNSCGTPTEVLNKEPLFPSYENCSQCNILIQKLWIQEAIKFNEEN